MYAIRSYYEPFRYEEPTKDLQYLPETMSKSGVDFIGYSPAPLPKGDVQLHSSAAHTNLFRIFESGVLSGIYKAVAFDHVHIGDRVCRYQFVGS